MAIGSGISSQVGVKKETTYGTRVAPTQFWEFESEGGQRQQKYLESRQLRAGRFFQSSSRRALTTHDAQVTLAGEFPNKGGGFLLDLLHGNSVTPVQQTTTTAYLQTHNVTGDPNKSATIQVGKPSANGTVNPFDYVGCMVTSANFACAIDDWLKFNFTFDAQDEQTNQTLATASYPTALESFHFEQCSVSVNGVTQDLATTGALVKGFSLDLSLPRATERYGLRSTALKAKPILNDYTPGSGSLSFEFDDMTQYGLFTAGTKVPVVITFTSSSLAGTGNPFALTFTMSSCQFTGTTPAVGGPDILSFDAPFSILDDGTNPPVAITYMSTDTAAL